MNKGKIELETQPEMLLIRIMTLESKISQLEEIVRGYENDEVTTIPKM